MTTARDDTATFAEYLERQRAAIDAALARALPRPPACPGLLHEALEYSLRAGGKRLRPVLTMAAADAVIAAGDGGGAAADALPAACAIELIHTYSLIHDDLPAMDDDTMRRGRPTLHVVYGDGIAILAGDALQALAFEALSQPSGNPADPTLRLEMLAQLARAAGAAGMVGGQAIDLESVGRRLDQQALETMHRHKTGALIEASVRLGALASGKADALRLEALQTYARAIGLAFQVQDDILDVESDTTTLGKTQGKDQAHDKPTYPALLGLPAAKAYALELRDQAHAALAGFGEAAEPLRQLANFIVERRS